MRVFHCRHHFAPRSLNLLSNNSTRPCHAQRGQSSHMEEPRLQSLTPYTGVQGAEKKKCIPMSVSCGITELACPLEVR